MRMALGSAQPVTNISLALKLSLSFALKLRLALTFARSLVRNRLIILENNDDQDS
jgi:hypothetical protein